MKSTENAVHTNSFGSEVDTTEPELVVQNSLKAMTSDEPSIISGRSTNRTNEVRQLFAVDDGGRQDDEDFAGTESEQDPNYAIDKVFDDYDEDDEEDEAVHSDYREDVEEDEAVHSDYREDVEEDQERETLGDELEAEPEPEKEPEHEPEEEMEQEPSFESERKSERESEMEPEPELEPVCDQGPEAVSEAVSEPQLEPQPEPQPEPETEPETEPQPEPQPELQPEPQQEEYVSESGAANEEGSPLEEAPSEAKETLPDSLENLSSLSYSFDGYVVPQEEKKAAAKAMLAAKAQEGKNNEISQLLGKHAATERLQDMVQEDASSQGRGNCTATCYNVEDQAMCTGTPNVAAETLSSGVENVASTMKIGMTSVQDISKQGIEKASEEIVHITGGLETITATSQLLAQNLLEQVQIGFASLASSFVPASETEAKPAKTDNNTSKEGALVKKESSVGYEITLCGVEPVQNLLGMDVKNYAGKQIKGAEEFDGMEAIEVNLQTSQKPTGFRSFFSSKVVEERIEAGRFGSVAGSEVDDDSFSLVSVDVVSRSGNKKRRMKKVDRNRKIGSDRSVVSNQSTLSSNSHRRPRMFRRSRKSGKPRAQF